MKPIKPIDKKYLLMIADKIYNAIIDDDLDYVSILADHLKESLKEFQSDLMNKKYLKT